MHKVKTSNKRGGGGKEGGGQEAGDWGLVRARNIHEV